MKFSDYKRSGLHRLPYSRPGIKACLTCLTICMSKGHLKHAVLTESKNNMGKWKQPGDSSCTKSMKHKDTVAGLQHPVLTRSCERLEAKSKGRAKYLNQLSAKSSIKVNQKLYYI